MVVPTVVPEEFAHLVGRRLPGGPFQLGESENWLLHDSLYSHPDDHPHPVAAYVAAQRGMGITVAELFSMFGAAMTDGPLLAGCDFEFPGILRCGTEYTVTASIESVERKDSRSLGQIDFVRCRMELSETYGGELVSVVRNTYAIPRTKTP